MAWIARSEFLMLKRVFLLVMAALFYSVAILIAACYVTRLRFSI
jgi:hypothetical protein